MEDHSTIYEILLPKNLKKKSSLNLIKPLEVTPSYRDCSQILSKGRTL